MTESAKWNKNRKAVCATQVAFELEKRIAHKIHEMALCNGLTPSNQLRKLIGLAYALPKRPRLTMSLSQEDYSTLGEKYDVNPNDTLEIKRMIMQEIIQLVTQ
jgi:hypothetical protein